MNIANKLTFDSGTHVYHHQGTKVPSVTQILEPFNSFEHVDSETLRVAGEFGTHVHEAVHLLNVGELDRESLSPLVEKYLAGWESFLKDSGAVVIYSEEQVYSSKMGYAGTFDSIVMMRKKKRLIDVKTSTTIPKTVGPQTAAYAEAWHEMTGQRRTPRLCVHLNPKLHTGYSLHQLSDTRDLDIFKAALSLHRWITKT